MQATHYKSEDGDYLDSENNKVMVISGDYIFPAKGLDVIIEEVESEEEYCLKHNLILQKENDLLLDE